MTGNYKNLEKKLTMQKKSCWETWNDSVKKKAFDFAEGYKSFLNIAKTEQESVIAGVEIAKKNGFKNIAEMKNLKPGDKVYYVHQDKSMVFAKIGKKGLKEQDKGES